MHGRIEKIFENNQKGIQTIIVENEIPDIDFGDNNYDLRSRDIVDAITPYLPNDIPR